MLSRREKSRARAERDKNQTGKTLTKFTTTYFRKYDV
jgi:hypothetical protein